MMAMGATLTLDEFRRVLREKKKGIAVGWCCQFGIMPLLSYTFARAAGFDTLTATGRSHESHAAEYAGDCG